MKKSPTTRIRVAQMDDGDGMRGCGLQVFPAETNALQYFLRILSAWPGLSHVAVNDKDEIVGICLVRVKEEIKDAIHAHVSSLGVLPKYQSQGVARGLLTASLQSARTLYGVSEVTLNVRRSNEPAIGLYTSMKFYTTKTNPRHYYDGEDAFSMNLLLKDDVP